MFEVNGWHKFGERDYFETGCDPDDYISYGGPERWSVETVEGLLNQLRGFVGVDDDYEVVLDACEEDGRVDIGVMETDHAYPASEHDLELWKRGELALWYSVYTFYVEQVERKPVQLVNPYAE